MFTLFLCLPYHITMGKERATDTSIVFLKNRSVLLDIMLQIGKVIYYDSAFFNVNGPLNVKSV